MDEFSQKMEAIIASPTSRSMWGPDRVTKILEENDTSTTTRDRISRIIKTKFLPPFWTSKTPQESSPLMALQSETPNVKLDKFTIFANLPLEIAQKIWRSTFEKRHVDLGPPAGLNPAEREERSLQSQFPVVFSVTTQSQEEMRRHYKIVAPGGGYNSWVALNPKIDSVFISLRGFGPRAGAHTHHIEKFNRHMQTLNEWLSHFDSCTGGAIERITELEIRDLEACVCFFTWTDSEFLKTLLRFKGLRKLCITLAEESPYDLIICPQAIERYLEEYKDQFASGKEPEVKTRQWEELGDMPSGFGSEWEIEEDSDKVSDYGSDWGSDSEPDLDLH